MSDLHGEDAFTTVLDRMVEAEKRAAVAEERERRDTSRAVIEKLGRELDIAHATNLTLEAKKKSALPKLVELWDAAGAVNDFIVQSISTEQRLTPDSDLIKRLRTALEAARDDCGQLPF